MSLFRYKVAISKEDDQVFSVNNFYASIYEKALDFEHNLDYYEDLEENGEIDYELYTGAPICHVLSWVGPSTTVDSPLNQLSEMADRKRTPWRLSNFMILNNGSSEFNFDLANPFIVDNEDTLWRYKISRKEKSGFSISLETRSDSFARTRYQIMRFRKTGFSTIDETIFDVSERASSYFRHLKFHFPDDGEAYCEAAEFRR